MDALLRLGLGLDVGWWTLGDFYSGMRVGGGGCVVEWIDRSCPVTCHCTYRSGTEVGPAFERPKPRLLLALVSESSPCQYTYMNSRVAFTLTVIHLTGQTIRY